MIAALASRASDEGPSFILERPCTKMKVTVRNTCEVLGRLKAQNEAPCGTWTPLQFRHLGCHVTETEVYYLLQFLLQASTKNKK